MTLENVTWACIVLQFLLIVVLFGRTEIHSSKIERLENERDIED